MIEIAIEIVAHIITHVIMRILKMASRLFDSRKPHVSSTLVSLTKSLEKVIYAGKTKVLSSSHSGKR